jgi:subtilisin family serine protease
MVRRALLSTLAALLLIAAGAGGASAGPERSERYIVVLHDRVDPGTVARDHARGHGAEISSVYRHAVKGYAATLPARRLDAVRSDPKVDYVEPDAPVTLAAQQLPWGVDRVGADVSSTRAGDGSGAVSGVHLYVIDTGVDSGHPDLDVVGHVNFAAGPNRDCNGHGTHVAGTASARDNAIDVVGAASGSLVTGVKVLGCNGSGSLSGVLRGIDWVTANAVAPAVANMSLGAGPSRSLDDAVKRSADRGITYVLAAGNESADACGSSPARAGTHAGVITVAATDRADAETSWSNYGACVDLWAPGAGIVSTSKGGGTTVMSGTSMAAPHVAGGAALVLSSRPSASAATVESALEGASVDTGRRSKDGRQVRLVEVSGF